MGKDCYMRVIVKVLFVAIAVVGLDDAQPPSLGELSTQLCQNSRQIGLRYVFEYVAGKSEINTAIGEPTQIRQLAHMSVNAGCGMFRNSRPFIDRESLTCPYLVNKVAMTGSQV